MSRILVAAGVIFNKRGQILLAQRGEPEFVKGLWEFPGGKIEKSERPEMALHREIQEELELPIEIDFLIGEFEHTYQLHTIRIQAFACRALDEKFKVNEHLDVRWVEPDDLKNYPLVPADENIFPTLLGHALMRRSK